MSDQGFKGYIYLEGNRLKVYKDVAGNNTVCAGLRTDDPVGEKYTSTRCENINKKIWKDYQKIVTDAVTISLNDHELDALTLFVINIGGTQFRASTVLKVLNSGKRDLVPYQMQRWNKLTINGAKVVDDVLVNRRTIEAAMFVSGMYAKRADYMKAKNAQRPVSPDTKGLNDLFTSAKSWKTTWSGISTSGLGVLGMMSDKIHPLLLNGVLAGISFLGFFIVFNRTRDFKIGEHL